LETKPLIYQYRNDLLECVSYGKVCVVGEDGIRVAIGGVNEYSYYRSASKPIQALPVLLHRMDKKYGFTDSEIAVFSGSHWGEDIHIKTLESILQKTGVKEEQLIMQPTYPLNPERRQELIYQGSGPRRLYHNCAGKHIALILLARELGEAEGNYWKAESKVQKTILDIISELTDISADQIRMGVDGCGVPVYAVPLYAIALSFLRLICSDLIRNDELRGAVERNTALLHVNSIMLDGFNRSCAVFSSRPDLLSKAGALGVYAMGIGSLRLGGVVKISDGDNNKAEFCAPYLLRKLGYKGDSEWWKRLEAIQSGDIYNDNGTLVGKQNCVFNF
jgi:L-asparaginase II